MALGIHSLGYLVYFELLFAKLKVPMTPDVRHYLQQQQKARAYRIEKYKKAEVKKCRNTKLHDKLREYSEVVKKEIAKRNGCVYQPGIGMDGGYVAPAAAVTVAASALKKCSACGETGHSMRTNKKCRYYKKAGPAAAAEPAAEDDDNRDAQEQDLMDEIGFEASDDEFFDALEDDDEVDTSFF